jgi:subtilisin family serine protease
MKPLVLATLTALAFSACASGTPAPAPAPTPATPPEAAVPAQPAQPATPAPALIREAPRDWHLLDDSTDGVPGISANRAMRELLAGKQPQRTVLVAVIDGGFDTAHVDLRANLWTNPKEIAGNAKDDDRNGYVDDVFGWNFIGGPDGKNVDEDTYEVTRLYVRCTAGASGNGGAASVAGVPCDEVKTEYEKLRVETEQQLQQVMMIDAALSQILPMLREATGSDSLTVRSVTELRPANAAVQQARALYLQLAEAGITPKDVADAKKGLQQRAKFGLNTEFNPRPMVGDDTTNLTERRYGNRDVMGPDAEHGTHVAGIIAAVRGNGEGVDGIAPAVKIIAVRAVPNGDERDKDIANAIRYAVDHGAQVINMSFGKGFSPNKTLVDEAVKYAEQKGVLLVHGSGNDGEDVETNPSFPTPFYAGGGRSQNWIEVGASGWKSRDSLAAQFSNYGREQVDLFAPGVDIYSTVPGSKYEPNSGTSMASPVVAGVAALLLSYYPGLTPAQVKQIILDSARRYPGQMVARPGEEGGMVPFADLSATGGIVNVYRAVKMAEEMTAARP